MNAGSLENVFFGVCAVVLLLLMWRGWQQGVARMLANLIGIAAAYAVGFYAGPVLGFLFRPLGFPNQILSILGGITAGFIVFGLIWILSLILLKRTSQQPTSVLKLIYGGFGSLLGTVIAAVVIGVMIEGVLLLGSLASIEVEAAKKRAKTEPQKAQTSSPGEIIEAVAGLHEGLKEGVSGKVIKDYNPVPDKVPENLSKIGRMVSNPESVDRFLEHPGVNQLAKYPKLQELREDGEVSELLRRSDFVNLLRHPKIRDLANDEKFVEMVKKMEFQKALDGAVRTSPEPELGR